MIYAGGKGTQVQFYIIFPGGCVGNRLLPEPAAGLVKNFEENGLGLRQFKINRADAVVGIGVDVAFKHSRFGFGNRGAARDVQAPGVDKPHVAVGPVADAEAPVAVGVAGHDGDGIARGPYSRAERGTARGVAGGVVREGGFGNKKGHDAVFVAPGEVRCGELQGIAGGRMEVNVEVGNGAVVQQQGHFQRCGATCDARNGERIRNRAEVPDLFLGALHRKFLRVCIPVVTQQGRRAGGADAAFG